MQFNTDNILVPDELEKVVEENMSKIYKKQKQKNRKKLLAAFTSAAAILVGAIIFLTSNPVLAAKIPFVGGLFKSLQNDITYSGDYTKAADLLKDEEKYSRTAGDMTVILSEVYCNEQALYLTMMLKSKDAFQDTLTNQEGQPVLAVSTKEKYKFLENQREELRYLEGKFTDEKIYTGIMRVDLNELGIELSEDKAIPSDFILDFQIDKVIGEKKEEKVLEAVSGEEQEEYENPGSARALSFPNEQRNYWYDGPWAFQLDVSMDHTKTKTVKVNTTNEDGVGIERVVKTPYELSIYETYPSEAEASDYFAVVVDENGDILPQGSGLTNTYALQGKDMSAVYVYICDYIEYMDELKAYYWSDDYEENKKTKTFKELLDERAVYKEKVDLH